MTEPTSPPGSHHGPTGDDDESTAVRELRARLRDVPPPPQELVDRQIALALRALDEVPDAGGVARDTAANGDGPNVASGSVVPGSVVPLGVGRRAPSGSPPRRVLAALAVAAATVLVVGVVGAVATRSDDDTSSGDQAALAPASQDATGKAAEAGAAAHGDLGSDVVGPEAALPPAVGIVDLGVQPDVEAVLRAWADATPTSLAPTVEAVPAPPAEEPAADTATNEAPTSGARELLAAPCGRVVATAIIAGRPAVVVEGPGGPDVVDPTSCRSIRSP